MRPSRARPLLCLVCLLAACGDPDPAVTTTELRLRFPEDTTCQPPGEVTRLRVEALGDFASAATDQRVETFGVDGPQTIDRFPVGTELLTVTAEAAGWHAGGLHRVAGQTESRGLLLLPLGRSCVSEDPEVRLRDGAAAVALPDGGLVLFGGMDGGDRLRTIVRVPAPGEGQLARVMGALSDPRVGASATLVGRRVVVAGGEGEDNDTYDLFDIDSDSVDFGLLPSVRHHHGALRLDDHRVLLVGGEDRSGTPLATAATIDIAAGEAVTLDATLGSARTGPRVLRLDDGSVYVVGGQLAGGGVATQVELFDERAEAFVETEGAVLESWAGAVAVALPGARIAWLGGESGPRAQVLTLERGPGAAGDVTVDLDGALPTGDLAAAVLDDGTILLVGDGDAAVVDVGRGTVSEADWTRPARALVPLSDGSLVELEPDGASLRRELIRTPFDNPPNSLLPADVEWVSLDAAPRWRGGENVSAEGTPALAVVPTLRFSDFRVTPVVDGRADLLLRASDGSEVRVVLDPDRADILGCQLEHDSAAAVTVERRGDHVHLITRAGDDKSCRVDLPDLVGLALRVYPASTFVALSDLERL